MRFTLETDHKHLLSILSFKVLDELTFSCDILHVSRKLLITADTFSQAPVEHTQAVEEQKADIQIFVDTIRQSLPANEARLQQIGKTGRKKTTYTVH